MRTGGASGFLAERLEEGGEVKVFIEHNDNFSNLSEFLGLMDGWKVNMKIDVWPGIPLVFNLTQPEN